MFTLSPYSLLCQDFINDLNSYFVEIFNLASAYQYEGISSGDRYGILSFRSLTQDNSTPGQVRLGFEMLILRFDLLLTLGCTDRLSAEAMGMGAMLDLHHGIPALKDYLSNSALINDLKTDEQLSCVKRQALKPPNNWIVDITCGCMANLAIIVDKDGKHLMRN